MVLLSDGLNGRNHSGGQRKEIEELPESLSAKGQEQRWNSSWNLFNSFWSAVDRIACIPEKVAQDSSTSNRNRTPSFEKGEIMITLEKLKDRLLQNSRFLKEYERADAEYSLVESLIGARLSAGLTQSQVAERMGTTQSAVARLESGMVSPSFTTLRRFAEATRTKVRVNFVPIESSVEDE